MDLALQSSSEGEKNSAGPIAAGEMYVGCISTSQQSGSSITAGQSVGGQPSIIAGKIIAKTITVNNMPQASITADQNVNAVVQPVSDNVSRGNTIVTGANRLPSKEGKLWAKF